MRKDNTKIMTLGRTIIETIRNCGNLILIKLEK